nr:hypothetical protein [Tanacetum cinerariifolium]
LEIAVLRYDGDECDKGRMSTKIELTLEQSQQVKIEILLEPSSNKLLVGAAKRWVDRLLLGTVDSWDLLKKAFIQRYYPPSRTAKRLEEIRNFKQEGDETLYQAWEQYNEFLYKCPNYDINNHHKWHDGLSSRSNEGSSYEGIAAIVNKLENLGRDMKKLKEIVHTIQIECQMCEGAHLDKDCPLNKEVKDMEEVKYGEFSTIHHQELPNGLRKSATSSKKEMRRYTKLGNGIMNFYINALIMTSITIIRSNEGSSYEGIAAIVNKLENLGRDTKKLKEIVHTIQIECQMCEGAHLDKDCPLNKEVKDMEEVKYGEFSQHFPNNRYDGRFNKGGYDKRSSGEKRPSLTEIINKYMEEAFKRQVEQDECSLYKEMEFEVPLTRIHVVDAKPAKELTLIKTVLLTRKLRVLKKLNMDNSVDLSQTTDMTEASERQAEQDEWLKKFTKVQKLVEKLTTKSSKVLRQRASRSGSSGVESIKKIKINRPLLKEIRKTDSYAKQIKDLVEHKPRTKEDGEIRMNPRCSALLRNHLPPKEQDPKSFILPCSIGRVG